jgi:hypothetical protein
MKEADESFAFWIVFEFCFENVLDVIWIGCYYAVDFAGTDEDGGVGWTVTEDLSCPVKEAVAV